MAHDDDDDDDDDDVVMMMVVVVVVVVVIQEGYKRFWRCLIGNSTNRLAVSGTW